MNWDYNFIREWEMPKIFTQKCKKCGSVYSLTKHKSKNKDKDKIVCEVCGAKLLKWEGAVTYLATLTERHKQK